MLFTAKVFRNELRGGRSVINIINRMYSPRKFVDKVVVETAGGKGGNGCVSFEVLSPSKRRPNGGSGGKGGSVYVVADKNVIDLTFDTYHFNGGDGNHGGSDGRTGRRGKDIYIRVPLGTLVTERDGGSNDDFMWEEGVEDMTDEEIEARLAEEAPEPICFDMSEDQMTVIAADGGDPGVGNGNVEGVNRLQRRSIPKTKMPGQAGQTRSLILELKMIADVGLVGFPNAGKSSLLTVLSNARPKVAPYPFTTLHPSIGIIEYSDLERITMADIPGLIDGAHENRGLGHEFLRHVERTKVLLYVLDGPGSEGRNPAKDLKTLMFELKEHDEKLLDLPQLIFANKLDITESEFDSSQLEKLAKKHKIEIIRGSTVNGVGLAQLTHRLREMVTAANIKRKAEAAEAAELAAQQREEARAEARARAEQRKLNRQRRGAAVMENKRSYNNRRERSQDSEQSEDLSEDQKEDQSEDQSEDEREGSGVETETRVAP